MSQPSAPHATSAAPHKPASLRLRLLVGAVLWIGLSVLLAGWGLAQLFHQHASTQFRNELTLHLNQLTAAFLREAPQGAVLDSLSGLASDSAPDLHLSDPRLAQPLSGLYGQIDRLDVHGRTVQTALWRSRSLWDQTLPLRSEIPPENQADEVGDFFYETTVAGTALLVLARTLHLDGEDDESSGTGSDTHPPETAIPENRHWHLSIAADRQLLHAPVAHFNRLLVMALGLLALGMSGAALGLVMGGLRPLIALRRRLTDVAAGRTAHLSGAFPAEIQPLVDEFNTVLRRNAEMVQRARTQAGNLAHAVKTPLTILDNAAREEEGKGQGAGQDAAAGALKQLVSEQVQIARRQIDWHLARARATAGGQASGVRTRLDDILPALVRTMQRLHAQRSANRSLDIVMAALPVDGAGSGLTGKGPTTEGLAVRGEAQDVQEMLGNLLDNACKWAHSRVQVSVEVARGEEVDTPPHAPARVTLHVDDDGPGLPAADIQAAFRRGVRLDERQPGTGLGLSIVAEMAELYQGSVQADVSPLGGLRMSLTLPAA